MPAYRVREHNDTSETWKIELTNNKTKPIYVVKQDTNDARRSERLLLIALKHTYPERTGICCMDEATRRREIYHHTEGMEGKQSEGRQGKKQEGRDKGEKREHRTPDDDNNMGVRLT